jgi:ABC-2 type transport system ATP-binding protein
MHEMRDMIESLVDEGRTVMLSSHLLDEVQRMCHAVAIVDHGRVIRQGPINELLRTANAVVRVECADPGVAASLLSPSDLVEKTDAQPGVLSVTLRAGSTRDTVAELNRRLVEGGIAVYGLQEVQTSLEDWFLSVTSRLGEPAP